MNVGSLFTGIGGFDLGLERAGMRVMWQCESNAYRRAVLRKHWPGVPCYEDVRTVDESAEWVDLICGGFPCQDLSLAGKGAGITGSRSGLWSEFARIVGELRPRYVLVENVPALAHRGLGRVLGDLAARGYDAEWDCLPASAFGAPHRRDRLWLVAYPSSEPRRMGKHRSGGQEWQPADAREPTLVRQANGTSGTEGLAACNHSGNVADPQGESERTRLRESGTRGERGRRPGDGGSALADPSRNGEAGTAPPTGAERERAWAGGERSGANADPDCESPIRASVAWAERGQWSTEPDVGRVADGVPSRVDRLSALGDSLVPQIAEWIGRRIMTWEAEYEMGSWATIDDEDRESWRDKARAVITRAALEPRAEEERDG